MKKKKKRRRQMNKKKHIQYTVFARTKLKRPTFLIDYLANQEHLWFDAN